jgi:hypothetical protein
MHELINMLKEFDREPPVVARNLNNGKADAGSSDIFNDLHPLGQSLYHRIMSECDNSLILDSGRWNRSYWKELKALAAQQDYEITVEHGGADGDTARLETPHVIFWIDCRY